MGYIMRKNKLKLPIFFLGVTLIFIGIFLLVMSFKKEILDGSYIVDEVKNYESSFSSLSMGEVSVIQNIIYQGNGVFKVSFQNKLKKFSDNTDVLNDRSKLVITDNISHDYNILSDAVINGEKVSFDKGIVFLDGIKASTSSNVLKIEIDNKLVFKENLISIYVKLNNIDNSKKHLTNDDCYYSFSPSSKNSFYNKTGFQSYIIDGYGYIEIK